MKKEDNAQGLVPIPIVAVRKCTRCQNFKISYQTLVAFCAVLNPDTGSSSEKNWPILAPQTTLQHQHLPPE